MAIFNNDGVNLYYALKGNLESEETIVFLNGVMASTSSWNFQVPVFLKHYKILLHDFKGQLRSDKPDGPYTFKEHTRDLKLLINELNIDKVHIVGTSYGGEVGMRFAIDYPCRVKTLSIIDSVSELDEKLKQMVLGWKYLAKGDPYQFFWGMAPTIYGKTFLEKNKEFLEERAQAMRGIPADYFEGQIKLYDAFLEDVYMTNELDQIKCPTLVICGEEDILKERKFSEIIAREIENSEFVLIPDCGHVTIFEKPNVLNSVLLGFILKYSE